jgi:hypothetical protein
VTLLDDLDAEGVSLTVEDGRLVAQGRLTAKAKMQIRIHERALVRDVAERAARWDAAVLASNRGVLTYLARAHGYDERTIERAVEWIESMRPSGTFRVTPDRITIELHGDVTAVFRRHGGITCPQYWPESGGRRCVDYRGDGDCARPEHEKCVEWVKVNSR